MERNFFRLPSFDFYSNDTGQKVSWKGTATLTWFDFFSPPTIPPRRKQFPRNLFLDLQRLCFAAMVQRWLWEYFRPDETYFSPFTISTRRKYNKMYIREKYKGRENDEKRNKKIYIIISHSSSRPIPFGIFVPNESMIKRNANHLPFLSQVNAPVFKKTTLYPRKIYLHYSEGGARNADENFSRDNVLPPINFYAKLVCFFYISRIVRQNVNEIKLARISTAVPHSRHFYPSPPNKREGYRRNFSIIFPSYTRPSSPYRYFIQKPVRSTR